MRNRLKMGLAALLAGAALAAQEAAAQAGTASDAAGTTVFRDVRVFDGERMVPNATVTTEGGVIRSVGEAGGAPIPQGAEIVDGAGRTLLPGLIDAHVHAFSRAALEQALVFGVTTELDQFTDEAFAAAMRAEQAAGGAADRADLFSAGTLATAPGGHGTQFGLTIPTLEGPEGAEAWVADRLEAGADWIKVVIEDGAEMGFESPTLDEATVRAVIEAAHAHGLQVVTHVQTLEAARTAIEAGTDGLAHMFSDAAPEPELVDLAAREGVFVIATASVFQSIGVDDAVDTGLLDDPELAPYLSATDRQSLTSPYTGFEDLSRAALLEGIERLHDAGVPILAGTDAPNPGTAHGASMHRELELLAEAGLSPVEALAAATSVPARTFGLDDRGRIAPGLRADLLLVEGDPTEDLRATRAIVGVWKGGVRADRASYRDALAAQREAAESQARLLAELDTARVSDFESGAPDAAFGQPWAPTTDAMAGGDSTAELAVVEGGADGSAYALEVTGEVGTAFALPWAGAMFMPGAQPFAPADLSARPVLTFAARSESGAGTYRLQLFCQNLGQVPPERAFEVDGEWRAFEFDLADVGGCDPSGLQAVVLSAGEPGPFDFRIDDVAFR